MKRLSPDEYIMGAMSLYLDFINLFLYILRVVSGMVSNCPLFRSSPRMSRSCCLFYPYTAQQLREPIIDWIR
jgi:hypothetical protein